MTRKKNPNISFRLRDAITDKLHYLIFTTLPINTFIDSLWNIVDTVGNEINACLNEAYYLVTQRNGSGEGKPQYFPHLAATSIYEAVMGKKIKGKNHGIKTGSLFQKINKTLDKVKSELKRKKLGSEEKVILKQAKSELKAQYNAILFALKQLPPASKKHLLAYQKLDVQNIEPLILRKRDLERIAQLHPAPVDETPKRPSTSSKQARDALVATEPPAYIREKPIARKLFQ